MFSVTNHNSGYRGIRFSIVNDNSGEYNVFNHKLCQVIEKHFQPQMIVQMIENKMFSVINVTQIIEKDGFQP